MTDKRKTTTVTKTNVREQIAEAVRSGRFTAEEEQVLRMRYGIAAKSDEVLEARGQRFPETRAQLAMLEKQAADAIDLTIAQAKPATNPSAKAQIIAGLADD